jgi:hypothetical protein
MLKLVEAVYSDKSIQYQGLGVMSCSGISKQYDECIAKNIKGDQKYFSCSELGTLGKIKPD